MIPELVNLEEAQPISEEAGIVSTDPNIYKRVVREMNEVNEDFHSLRTVVTPSVNGMMNVFNFVMYPNDGAFCSLPLIGRIVIPPSYPVNPPVFHLFTRTNRYNLDVFNSAARYNNMDSSSICFDIVKPTSMNVSTWKPEFTISTVFASIMSAIVSYKVEQMGGGFKDEAVSMESLCGSMLNVQNEIKNRWKEISKLPKIPIVKSVRLMCQEIKFPLLEEWDYYELHKGE
jgi:ubiquitin-protein ligase